MPLINSKFKPKYIVLILLIIIPLCACGKENVTDITKGITTVTKTSKQTTTVTTTSQIVTSTQKQSTAKTTTFVEPEKVDVYIGQVVCTANDFVNIREQAGVDSQKSGQMSAGQIADVIDYQDQWAYIAYEDIKGYVSREYLINRSVPDIEVPYGDWADILVNSSHFLPEDFSVELCGFEGGEVDVHIYEICVQMFSDAKKDGVSLVLVDAYRSFEHQSELYQKKVEKYLSIGYDLIDAEEMASTITARPNTSEHQTGLALDIVTDSYRVRDKAFENTKAFKWLKANAHNYGFSLRYRPDKTAITKVIYEPWHWRFFGVEKATEMKETGQCYEEYVRGAD